MTTDNKTLADVQPGGRVRLGDVLPPLPKMQRFTNLYGETYAYSAEQMRDYARAALSAQPSPGGQGDALLDQARKLFDELGAIADDDKCVAILAAALAARQPVGEPAYNSAGISLTACQLHEALLMAGDPELDVPFEDRSLVRIFWTETGHSGPGLYCECVGAEEEGCILLDGTAPAIGQSAQAVDLPYSLDADQAGIRARVCDVITGTLMVGAQGHTPPPAGHWAEPFWKAARADAAAQAVDLERFRPAVMTALGLSSPYGLERETLNGLLDLIDSHGARNG
ncbi:TPA: hypothetical protein ACXM54_000734 [Stenotrophomonas maltophilia]|uniref:hypothetical protein n=1 Tax=Stenotrophomonas maltophilia TaxID=40324 RepID=UPI0018D28D0D|nr:hypothetical protein [Stenotrophomonas maltophilia]HDS1622189.1 hypothetical protein [Stenotrophomonas maltophilia]HEL3740271.1 hypothetical protein [Stenotrophomonas maltophilia]HEL3760499.1 hypothetical protein [Stenotrophomonas maltophilia]